MPEDKPQETEPSAGVKPGRKARATKREPTPKVYCGVIMPISAIDGCNEQH